MKLLPRGKGSGWLSDVINNIAMNEKTRPPPSPVIRRVYQQVIYQPKSFAMAITLNKYARQCERAAIVRGTITRDSSYRPFLYDVSRDWRRQADASAFKSEELNNYSERHVAGADVIIDQLLCLRRDGCENIEKLLRERVRQRFGIL